ncbi:MAG TPA: hypothetical protein VG937_31375 [Polyangiaceae bacterium]|nr:hypothetical protein [Polyangiaceae bacterium]
MGGALDYHRHCTQIGMGGALDHHRHCTQSAWGAHSITIGIAPKSALHPVSIEATQQACVRVDPILLAHGTFDF